MPSTVEPAATPPQAVLTSARTSHVLFGRMCEDACIELQAFPPRSRVFAIASAGCVARRLAAAGHDVTAVDINPEQVAYAEARANGAPFREGAAEHILSRGRGLLSLMGWTESKRREFLSLDDPPAQILYWHQALESRAWRAGLDTLLSHWVLRLVYGSPFMSSLPKGFGPLVRARLERAWRTHPNRFNPFAWHLLVGSFEHEESLQPVSVRFACGDAAAYLESCPSAHFQAITLSNILDGAPASYGARLRAAIGHAAAPDAVIVTRSFAEPEDDPKHNFAARDRSLLWGRVDVRRVEEL